MALWHWLVGGAAALLLTKKLGGSVAAPTNDQLTAVLVAFQAVNPSLGNNLTMPVYFPASGAVQISNAADPTKTTTMLWTDMASKFATVGGVLTYTGPTYSLS